MQKFSDWLRTYRAGVIDDLLTAAINEVAPAVGLHQKKGSVTLKPSRSPRRPVVWSSSRW